MSIPATDSRAPWAARSGARTARLAVALLLAINLFNYIDRYVLAAMEPRIAEALLPTDPNALAKMGSLATAFILSYMITAPIFGWLADRMSRWLLAGLGVILWTIASGGSGLAVTFSMLLITRLFVGVGEAGYGPAAPTLIADLFPIEKRGQVMAYFYMAIPVGGALGYVFGGVVGSHFGWRAPFIAVVPPGLLLGGLCFLMKDPRRATDPRRITDPRLRGAIQQTRSESRPPRAGLADYRSLLGNPSYLLDCAGMTAMTFAIGGISFWMPRYISQTRSAGSLAHVNMMFGAITATAGIAGTLLGGIAGDKLRRRIPASYFLVSALGIFIACPAVVLMLYLPFPGAWAAIFVAEFFLFFNTGPTNAILANVTRPTVRATAFAINIFLIHALGDALSPPLLGGLAHRASWNAAFGAVVAAMALAGVLWLVGMRDLARDTQRVAALELSLRQNAAGDALNLS
jgi:MFS family permease